jgi:FecR protein
VAQKRKSAFQISYVTITYRSVLLAICLLLVLGALFMFFAFPDFSNRLIASGQLGLGKVLAKVGLGGSSTGLESGQQQAHFTNIDGTVRVKKANSSTWVQADYSLALERNDVVQTSPEGIAKVAFTDGTNYTVKPDSLIVIQENSLNEAKQTQVAVNVTTGTVDLATSTIGPGSKSQVSVAGATASIASDTQAEVMNDPRHDDHEILATKGSIVVDRGGQSVPLAANEKVAFKDPDSPMVKSKEIGPPVLIDPANLQQVILGNGEKTAMFSWSEVPNVRAYHVRISKTAFFNANSVIFDRKIAAPATQVPVQLTEGTYYWVVQSVGENDKESVESEKPRFTVGRKSGDSTTIALEVNEFVQHGHRIEVRGRTEPGAMVMINRQQALVKEEGTFLHFTDQLPTGENMITITAQNSKGGSKTISRSVTIAQ